MSMLKVDNFYQFFVSLIYLYHPIMEGNDVSMRKDITIEKLIVEYCGYKNLQIYL